jgi:hypothetical protein
MVINELKEHLIRTKSLSHELRELKNNDLVKLSDYLERFHNSLIYTDFGERDKFWLPYWYASKDLEVLLRADSIKLNSQFTANKKKLLSIVNQHIKNLQLGFHEYDLESPLTRDK